ncbi:hypothetical protein Nepgr_024872 [Nepenthes gracilis]|uniref:RecA family profile 2 domain-containing protein n=1 Tax=Nepenthes gracilis TaxID=150966 RepID=A0AAD3T5X4_NEPGR|nr:hypothetical protein Nepgr_024872 [Nepenthes gracilis]
MIGVVLRPQHYPPHRFLASTMMVPTFWWALKHLAEAKDMDRREEGPGSKPDKGEMALELADRLCQSSAIHQICVDSILALTPRAEIEGEIWMQQMGLQTQLMSQTLRKLSGIASKAGCTLIFLNQIRCKIGVYYANSEVTSGGIALKFFASLCLEIRPRVSKPGCISTYAEVMDVVTRKWSWIAEPLFQNPKLSKLIFSVRTSFDETSNASKYVM